MDSRDAQKSEMHDTTDDASTSPAARLASQGVSPSRTTEKEESSLNASAKAAADLSPTAHIVRDETDNGGPLVIETDRPLL